MAENVASNSGEINVSAYVNKDLDVLSRPVSYDQDVNTTSSEDHSGISLDKRDDEAETKVPFETIKTQSRKDSLKDKNKKAVKEAEDANALVEGVDIDLKCPNLSTMERACYKDKEFLSVDSDLEVREPHSYDILNTINLNIESTFDDFNEEKQLMNSIKDSLLEFITLSTANVRECESLNNSNVVEQTENAVIFDSENFSMISPSNLTENDNLYLKEDNSSSLLINNSEFCDYENLGAESKIVPNNFQNAVALDIKVGESGVDVSDTEKCLYSLVDSGIKEECATNLCDFNNVLKEDKQPDNSSEIMAKTNEDEVIECLMLSDVETSTKQEKTKPKAKSGAKKDKKSKGIKKNTSVIDDEVLNEVRNLMAAERSKGVKVKSSGTESPPSEKEEKQSEKTNAKLKKKKKKKTKRSNSKSEEGSRAASDKILSAESRVILKRGFAWKEKKDNSVEVLTLDMLNADGKRLVEDASSDNNKDHLPDDNCKNYKDDNLESLQDSVIISENSTSEINPKCKEVINAVCASSEEISNSLDIKENCFKQDNVAKHLHTLETDKNKILLDNEITENMVHYTDQGLHASEIMEENKLYVDSVNNIHNTGIIKDNVHKTEGNKDLHVTENEDDVRSTGIIEGNVHTTDVGKDLHIAEIIEEDNVYTTDDDKHLHFINSEVLLDTLKELDHHILTTSSSVSDENILDLSTSRNCSQIPVSIIEIDAEVSIQTEENLTPHENAVTIALENEYENEASVDENVNNKYNQIDNDECNIRLDSVAKTPNNDYNEGDAFTFNTAVTVIRPSDPCIEFISDSSSSSMSTRSSSLSKDSNAVSVIQVPEESLRKSNESMLPLFDHIESSKLDGISKLQIRSKKRHSLPMFRSLRQKLVNSKSFESEVIKDNSQNSLSSNGCRDIKNIYDKAGEKLYDESCECSKIADACTLNRVPNTPTTNAKKENTGVSDDSDGTDDTWHHKNIKEKIKNIIGARLNTRHELSSLPDETIALPPNCSIQSNPLSCKETKGGTASESAKDVHDFIIPKLDIEASKTSRRQNSGFIPDSEALEVNEESYYHYCLTPNSKHFNLTFLTDSDEANSTETLNVSNIAEDIFPKEHQEESIVERWEALQTKAIERQRQSTQLHQLQRQIRSLRLSMDSVLGRCSSTALSHALEDLSQISKKVDEMKGLADETENLRNDLSNLNVMVHRFTAEIGASFTPLKDEMAELYRLWDETQRRVNGELTRLQNADAAWRLWEEQKIELSQALKQDSDTLKVIDAAIDSGKLTETVSASVRDVAKLLNERRKLPNNAKNKSQLMTSERAELNSKETNDITTEIEKKDDRLSDSGTSGYESCSSDDLSERERRLAYLRRLARDLEGSLVPGSKAWNEINSTLTQAEMELKELQDHCRTLILKTAETLEPISKPSRFSSNSKRRNRARDGKGCRNPRVERRIKNGGSRREWVWRVARAAVPFQAALLLLFCVACLLEPNCCDSVNTFNLSFTPQLRYVPGSPPV